MNGVAVEGGKLVGGAEVVGTSRPSSNETKGCVAVTPRDCILVNYAINNAMNHYISDFRLDNLGHFNCFLIYDF